MKDLLLTNVLILFQFAAKMGTLTLKSTGNNAIDMAKELATHVLKTSQPIYNRLTVFVIGHILLSYVITYYQTENVEFLKFKLHEQHKEELELYHQSKKKNVEETK